VIPELAETSPKQKDTFNMSKISSNGKFLNLEGVRVSYRPKDDTIHITSTDEDLIAEGFHLTLSKGSASEFALRELLEEKGLIRPIKGLSEGDGNPASFKEIAEKLKKEAEAEGRIDLNPKTNFGQVIAAKGGTLMNSAVKSRTRVFPTFVPYPLSNGFLWNEIPIGQDIYGEPVVWNVGQEAHALLAGSSDSGKTVVQRSIFTHCLQHKNIWKVIGIDLKIIEFSQFKKFKESVFDTSTTLKESVKMLERIKEIMLNRYEEMDREDIKHFRELKDENGVPPYAFMIMIDETMSLIHQDHRATPKGTNDNKLRQTALDLITDIAQSGKEAGIYLMLATQRADELALGEELPSSLGTRIAMGRLDTGSSQMILNSAKATLTDSQAKGRGIIQTPNDEQEFQAYFITPDQLDVLGADQLTQ
jgi:hypothetical protein